MKTVDFYRGAGVLRALARAARAASMPVAVHVPQADKWVKVARAGSCSACARVASVVGGKAACGKSRGAASAAAAGSGMARPFICHAGFACLCTPAPGRAMLTFGPYCPAEAPESLAADFLAALVLLGGEPDALPPSLIDVRTVPSSVPPAIAAWTAETLETLWDRALAAESPPEGVAEDVPEARRRKSRAGKTADPYGAAAVCAALAGGAHDKARALFRGAMSETTGARKTAIGVKRARAVAAGAAVLESAARASLPVDACWQHFAGFMDETRQARNELQLVNAAMRLLGRIKRERRKAGAEAAADEQPFAELAEIVNASLENGITLNEVARKLNHSPTAITHRLQRNFGMSFSDYVGRLRIDKAKELLRRTRLTVEAVGRRVGIEDASNFRKLFRKFEPVTPQEYRQKFGVKK